MKKVEGYALIFNSESKDLGGFTEVIRPGALDGVLEKSDIVALFNHDESRGVLGRATKLRGSLKLSVDNKGLKYTFETPETNLGQELIVGIERGDIRTSSFSFICGDGQTWEKRDNGTILRTITKFESLHDVSPVVFEAYQETSVGIV